MFSGATYCLKYELVIFAEKSSVRIFQDFCRLQNEIDYEFCVVFMLISLENRIRSQFRYVNGRNPEKIKRLIFDQNFNRWRRGCARATSHRSFEITKTTFHTL